MLGFLSLLLWAQLAQEEGVKITLENTRFEDGKTEKWETRIMKLENKLRIEDTYPGTEEVCEVIIWDGKQCRLFIPNHKPQIIPPIRNGLEFIGFKEKVKEKGVKWEIDAKQLPLKKETRHGITTYEEWTKIKNFGYFPAKIEKYGSPRNRDRERTLQRELKNVDDEAELSNELFDPRLIEFSEEIKKFYKE